MKLYATTTSERASKGQGGNKFLEIKLLAGDKDNPIDMGIVKLEPWKEGYAVLYNGNAIYWSNKKGKKQKGECPDCNKKLATSEEIAQGYHFLCDKD